MTKTPLTLAAVLLFGLMLGAGGAIAGDGSCGGKKKDEGGSALVATPADQLG